MNRHQLREKCITCIYQHRLINKNLDDASIDVFGGKIKELNVFERGLLANVNENEEKYIQYCNEVLKDWTFNRLGYVEQAILLLACAEFDQKETSAAVIIDEAVNLAKSYCDEESYKLINGVLDKL